MDGDVGCSDVVSKLILARVALEKAIEIDISTAKFRSVVPGFQSLDVNLEFCVTTQLSGAIQARLDVFWMARRLIAMQRIVNGLAVPGGDLRRLLNRTEARV